MSYRKNSVIGQLIVLVMVLGKVDPNIVVPPRIVESSSIVVSPTIVESPRRTIFLLDCDVAGLSVLAGLSLSAMPVMGPDRTTMPLIQALTMTMTAAMIEQTVPSVPAVPVIMPSVTVMPICSTPAPCFEEQCVSPFMPGNGRQCYYLATSGRNWEDSRLDCLARGAVLWEPNNLAEAEAVRVILNICTGIANTVWTGASELDAHGEAENMARFTPSGMMLDSFANGNSCGNINSIRQCVSIHSTGTDRIWCFIQCDQLPMAVCEQQLNVCP